MSTIKVVKSAVKSIETFSSHSKKKLTYELSESSRNGDEDTVKRLLGRGAKIGSSLHAAAVEGHLGTVKILVEHGADIHKISKDHDCTPVMVAAWAGNLNVVEFLIEKGAFLTENSYRNECGDVRRNAFEHYGILSNLSEKTKKNHKKVLKECLYERLTKTLIINSK